MLWENLSNQQHEVLDKNIPVLLNIASIEQHGPALPVSTDSVIGWSFCLKINEMLGEKVLILPQLKICYSAHHMDFSGSLTVSHESLLSYLFDILESVIKQGFHHIFILNSHGGNQGIMQVLFEKIGNKYKKVNIWATSWWKLCSKELNQLKESGFMGNGHAAEFEFSLMEYLAPELVDYSKKSEGNRPTIGHPLAEGDLLMGPSVGLFRTFKETTVDGTYGFTDKASRQKGEEIFLIASQKISHLIAEINKIER